MFQNKNKSKYQNKSKFILAIVLLMLCVVVSGCQKNSSNGDVIKLPEKISDYYPFSPDTILHYKGVGNEFAQKVVSVDFIKGNRIQLRTNNGGTVVVDIMEIANGELRRVYSRAETYYRENLTAMGEPNQEVLLKEPLVKGTSWTLPGGVKREITAVDKEIVTPLGAYDAIEVTTSGSGGETHDYYAKGIGLVKSEFVAGSDTISSSLEKLENETAVRETMKFFYPYFDKDKVAYLEQDISLKTNEEILPVFESHWKQKPNADLSQVISKNVRINHITVDAIKNQVNIDFSKNLVTEMNAGSGLEGMIVNSIVNTLGDYYDVDKVYVTLDGEPYSSGHIAVGKDEPFHVDYGDGIKYE